MGMVPDALRHGPFTTAHARRVGVSRRVLAGRRYRQLFHGVHAAADLPLTLLVWIRAACLVLPADAVASHLTALRLWGLALRTVMPLHFSTATDQHRKRPGLVVHRVSRTRRTTTRRRGVGCTEAATTFVDCGTLCDLVELVQAADHLVHRGHVSLPSLAAFLDECHLPGVKAARRAFTLARERVESPMETLVRLALLFARLPEPEANPIVEDGKGRFLGRCDLVYWRWRVIVEYDGVWHERSRKQRAHDRTRRENLERAGWIVIVVLDDDLPHLDRVVWRVHAALKEHGYDGRAPLFNDSWRRWFGHRPASEPTP